MAQWMIMKASSGQKKGPFRSQELRSQLRSGQVQLLDYVAMKGSPIFRKVLFEDKIFEVYGAEFEDKEDTVLSHPAARNSFLGLASPEAVGRKGSPKKKPKAKVADPRPGRKKDREARKGRKSSVKIPPEVSGLKARQDKKAAQRYWQKWLRHMPYTAGAVILLLGLVWIEQSRVLRPTTNAVVTKRAPRVANMQGVDLKDLRKFVRQTVTVGPLRFRSASMRDCLKPQNKLAKCEIEVRDPGGGSAMLSFFYQAWGKAIMKRRENLYVTGMVLSDGRTIVLTELIDPSKMK